MHLSIETTYLGSFIKKQYLLLHPHCTPVKYELWVINRTLEMGKCRYSCNSGVKKEIYTRHNLELMSFFTSVNQKAHNTLLTHLTRNMFWQLCEM